MRTSITPGMLAKAIMSAADIRENSFSGTTNSKTYSGAAEEACTTNDIDLEWAVVIAYLLIGTWNKAIDWADAHRKS